jgi:hypothetical protein
LGDWTKLGEQPLSAGNFDEQSPLLGDLSSDLEFLERRVLQKPEVTRFIQALYTGGSQCVPSVSGESATRPSHFWMIPASLESAANARGEVLLRTYMDLHDPMRDREFVFQSSTFRSGVTLVSSVDNEWNDWKVQVAVDPAGIHLGSGTDPLPGAYFVPSSVVALHELEHVRRIAPGTPEEDGTPPVTDELGPVLQQIVLQDQIAKELSGSSLGTLKQYPCHPPVPEGKVALSLGETANLFRELIQKYGTPERAALSKEGLTFIRKHF